MEISFNLRTLIEKNNRVPLPGIGAFYKKRTEGFFDENKNSFFPPKEDISFHYNPNELNDSGEVSDAENGFIGSLTDKIKEAFSNSGEISIENLGKLKKKGDVIVFEKSVDLNSSFFGLPVLVIPKEELKQVPVPVTITESTENNTNFSLAEQALSVAIEDNYIPEEETRPKTWLYILLTLIILALGGFAVYQYRPDLVENAWKEVYPYPKPAATAPVVIADTDSLNKQIADSIYKEQIDIEEELKKQGLNAEKVKDSATIIIEAKPITNKATTRYEIVISAWRTESKALSEIKRLKAFGIDAHVVRDSDDSMKKISVGSFYHMADAEKELKKIKQEINPEAFIFVIPSHN